MKYFFILLLLFSNLWMLSGQQIPNIHYKQLQSVVYDTVREIAVFLPEEYYNEPERKFEVVYVFDAQKREVFNVAVSIADYLTENDANPMIIVGIKTNNRWDEFLPELHDSEIKQQIESFFGKDFRYGNANKLVDHLKNEIFPFVEKNYRALSIRIGIGHSFGGTFLTYATLRDPDLFNAAIAISPNYAIDKEQMVKHIENFKNAELPLNAYSFIAYGRQGDYEVSFYEATQKAIASLKAKGLLFGYKEFEIANHSSILPYGIAAGLSDYYDKIFLNGHNAIQYYQGLEACNEIAIDAPLVKKLSENCSLNGRYNDALIIAKWGLQKFPHNYDMYSTIAELESSMGNLDKTKEYYAKAITVLKAQKKHIDAKIFKEKMTFYKEALKKLEQ